MTYCNPKKCYLNSHGNNIWNYQLNDLRFLTLGGGVQIIHFAHSKIFACYGPAWYQHYNIVS